MKLKIWFPFLLSVALLFSGCEDDDDYEPEREIGKKTVLVYMVAENSLCYPFAVEDIAELLQGCADIPEHSKIVLYVDDLDYPRIYALTNKTKAQSLYDLVPEYEYDEDPNSCSADVLRQVMRYAVGKHPARKYGMVFWSHGSGWVPGGKDEARAEGKGRLTTFGVDNQHNTPDDYGYEMDITDMANALQEFDSLEFALFDACFMQTVESAYELKDVFDYIIGSPAEIPGYGAPYDKIVKPMFEESFNPDNLARAYYEHYCSDPKYGVLISSVRTSRLEDLAKATCNVLQGTSLKDGNFHNVQNYFFYDSWHYKSVTPMPDFYDMKSIMQENLTQERYLEWEKVFDEIVSGYATDNWFSVYSGWNGGIISVDSAKYGGISMYVPLQKYKDGSEPFVDYYYKTSWWNAINN